MPAPKRPDEARAREKGGAKATAAATASRKAAPDARGLRPGPPPSRIRIEAPAPAVEGGWPVKRTVGDLVDVAADVYRDGHESLRAVVRFKGPGDRQFKESPLVHIDAHHKGVRWVGSFPVDRMGTWTWTVEAWVDLFGSWRDELSRKIAFGQTDLAGELSEGVVLLEEAAERAKGADAELIEHALKTLRDEGAPESAKHDAALGVELYEAVERTMPRHEATRMEPMQLVDVDRTLARFGAWYELFPRSWGGFRGVADQIPRLAELGFDILYLPPVHPIGETNRKGRNNALVAGPDDPGSPWAIGHHEHGGHTALHPDLGSFEDFDHMVATAKEHGIEIALDFAIQCSADHPWLTEHPEWFHRRPDGTLKYAENPPKKYQDIYNVNWNSEDWRGLWNALLDAVLFWVDRGITVFRVDNPHTKPLAFWEWLIAEVRREHPETIFLAEAFTRRAVMRALAKLGFSQSYTYFTWKNSKWELTEYLDELAHGPEREYFRPNFFANTPDILHEYLQTGGPAAFAIRLVLASTLSPTYGIYSGYEHFENEPREEGSEEYLDSEKYEIRPRALDGPLLPLIQRLNHVRREHPALQHLSNLWWLGTENDAILAYAKRTGPDIVLTAVTLDPHHVQEGVCVVPYELGLPPTFTVEDLLTGERFDWRLGRNYVRFDPHGGRIAHVLTIAQ
ncbi:MAG TPA: alpha-1,4-glucan--maltose-1-phosphate maltosyltransferase [Thermoleophilaceae bacterium]|nr:alpha-1,4-glucan--maltose-1-phosphate maltosyltransferase [Thermoleophilaceae bacterium]